SDEAYRGMANAVNPYGDGQAARRTVEALRWKFAGGERPEGMKVSGLTKTIVVRLDGGSSKARTTSTGWKSIARSQPRDCSTARTSSLSSPFRFRAGRTSRLLRRSTARLDSGSTHTGRSDSRATGTGVSTVSAR